MRIAGAIAIAALLTALGCAQRVTVRFEPAAISHLSCRQQLPPGEPPAIWITPASSRNSQTLSRWCGTVGPVLFRSQAGADAGGAIDPLAIVSWNIHEGAGNVSDLVRRLRAGEFTDGAPIRDFVLLLQEATRRSRFVPAHVPRGFPVPHRIAPRQRADDADVQRLADQGFAVLYAPSMRNGEVRSRDEPDEAEDRGNAIVSTLALRDPRLIELPLERQRRVVAAAALDARDVNGAPRRIEIIDVHLDTSIAWLHGGPFAARRRQVAALLEGMRTMRRDVPAADVTVLGGDLNTWRGSGESAVRILGDAFPDAPDTEDAPTWRGPLGMRATLDHIFVRGPVAHVTVRRLPSRFGSDHYPLLAIVRLALQ